MADRDALQVPAAAVNVASKMDDDASDDRPVPRENMISNAVRFLQNPKVRESPFTQRKAFLAKKGLTSEEIDMAITRSGTAADATSLPPSGVTTNQIVPVTQLPPPVSPWARWRDHTATFIVVGGISYGIYHLLKKYILPLWLGPSEEERRAAALQTSIKEVETSLQTLVTSLGDIQKAFTDQQEQLRQVVLNTAASRGPIEYDRMQQQQSVTEIKGEIQSLKGLLLSRKQFPPTPKTTPVIPAWQLGGGSADSEAASAANRTPTDRSPTSPVLTAKSSTDTGVTTVQEASDPKDFGTAATTDPDTVVSTSGAMVNGTGEDLEVAQILKKEENQSSDPEPAETSQTSDILPEGATSAGTVTMATTDTS